MLIHISDTNYKNFFIATSSGMCLFFKKLCPHCLNMEKVLEKFSAHMPKTSLYAIDIEENPIAAQDCDAQRAPTLVVIKDGKVADAQAGLMNLKETMAFYEQA